MALTSFKSHAFLSENKVQWLKDNVKDFDTSFDVNAEHRDPEKIIDHWAGADPHPKKTNTQWIVNRYKKQDFRQEDHSRVKDALTNFERYKGKLEKKDINQYKSLNDVEDAVEPHLGQAASRKEEKHAAKIAGADKVYEGPNLKVYHIKTHDAACQYGAGTKWCTASRGYSGHFDTYTKQGPVYAVIGKHPDGQDFKYQFHFPSGQYMKEDDRPIPGGLGAFVKDHPDARVAFKGQHPLMDDPHEFNEKIASGHSYPGYKSAIEEDHSAGSLTGDTLEKARKFWHGQGAGDSQRHLQAIAAHPNTTVDTLDKMKNDKMEIRTAIAKNPSTPTHILDHLASNASNGETSVLNAVAEHKNSNPETLHSLAMKAVPGQKNQAVEKVAENPSMADHTRQHLMNHPEYYNNMLKNPASTTEHIGHIWNRTKTAVGVNALTKSTIEEGIGAHPNTSPDTLHEVAFGLNHLAASKALANPNLSADSRRQLYARGPDAVHAALAKSPHTPRDVLEKLKDHKNNFVQKMATNTLNSLKN